jgi:molybdate transport system ATP-binding protein
MLLKVVGLSFSYGTRPILKQLSWSWEKNHQWAILGPNGSGKSTLAKVLTQQMAPSTGELSFGENLSLEKIAYVCFEQQKALCDLDRRFDDSEFQSTAFDIGTTVEQAILGKHPATENFHDWVRRLSLEQILHRGIRFISTGEMRKTLLLRALLAEPLLIILDNPLDGLDRASQKEMQAVLRNLLSSDISILLMCRQMEDIPQQVSHVLVLDEGEAIACGEHKSVLENPIVIELMQAALPPLSELPPPASRPYTLNTHKPLIQMCDVSVSYYDNKVLDKINWTFNHGQHACISGPNGCGKTTLLSLINGDNHKAYGQDIFLFGQRRGSGESVWDIKQKFGNIDTQLQLNHVRGMKGIEVVISGFFDTIGLYDNWGDQQRNTAQHWLSALGVGSLETAAYDTLSFGMQRMLLLARAMVKSPAILILDEPCLGLDSFHRRLLLRAVDHIAGNSDTHILFVSHTVGDTPSCINQFLDFKPAPNGYQLKCQNTNPSPKT